MKCKKLRYLLIVSLAMLMMFAMSVCVFAADFNIDPNGSASGTFSKDNEEDTYTMTLPESGTLSVRIHADARKFHFRIYDANNDSYISGETIEKGDKELKFELAQGTYKLVFERFLIESGNYSLQTSFVPAGETYPYENNTINAVRAKDPVPFNTAINGQIAINDSDDYYRVVLKKSGRLKIRIHSEIEDVELSLYESANDWNLTNKQINKGDETVSYDLVAGTYFIRFSELLSKYGKYSFTNTFTAANETYTFENDTINAVRGRKAVPLSKTTTGQLAINDSKDYYKLVIPKAGKYTLNINSKMDSVSFEIDNSNDSYMAGQYGHKKGSKNYTYKFAKGTYYLSFDGSYTGVYKFTLRPTSVTLQKQTPSKTSAKITWKKGTGKGYEIQYSTNSKFKKNVKVKRITKASTVKTTIKNLKKNKKYYVRIRTYVNSGSKRCYSVWSKTKSFKTKR